MSGLVGQRSKSSSGQGVSRVPEEVLARALAEHGPAAEREGATASGDGVVDEDGLVAQLESKVGFGGPATGQTYEDYKAAQALDPKEGQYDELVDYAHYVCVSEMRGSPVYSAAEADEQEELFAIAHFLLRNCAWDPYKQSLLAICLIEKVDEETIGMWDKLLTPLERAYDRTSGEGFKNRFGYAYRATRGSGGGGGGGGGGCGAAAAVSAVTATRMHAEQILASMSHGAKEAGRQQLLPSEEKARGTVTPRDRAEREAKAAKVAAKAAVKDAAKDEARAAKRAAVEARVAAALAARKAELEAELEAELAACR